MTDLTEQGKNDVVSAPDWEKGDTRSGKYAEIEHQVEISNIGEVEESLATILEQSVVTGCKLNMADAFFLVVDKESKKAKVVIADLAEVEFIDTQSLDLREELVATNYNAILQFVRSMRSHIQRKNLMNYAKRYNNSRYLVFDRQD